MIIFETIEEYFRTLGVMAIPLPASLKKMPIQKSYEICVSTIFILLYTTILWFVIFEAETTEDLTETGAILCGLSPLFSCYWVFLQEKLNVIRIIDELKMIIKKSEFGLQQIISEF